MAAVNRDQSVSPTSHTPLAASSPPLDLATLALAAIRNERNNAIVQNQPDDSGNGTPSTNEARDYWNHGSPHQALPPGRSESSIKDPQNSTSAQGGEGRKKIEENPQPDGGPVAGRRSVQFARTDYTDSPPIHARHGSMDDSMTTPKSKGSMLMSRLKAFSGGANQPSPKSTNPAGGSPKLALLPTTGSPTPARVGNRLPGTLTEEHSDAEADADADADIEETADESNIPEPVVHKKKRRMRRPRMSNLSISTPSARFGQESQSSSAAINRILRRRASMPDTSARSDGVSEGEAGQSRAVTLRRGSSWMPATSRPNGDDPEDLTNPHHVGRRGLHVRRVTVLGGGGLSDGDAAAPRRPFFNHERASTYGAHKWKQVKNTLKLLRQKKEDRVDYFKSAELMAELRAGAPAVLMLASMIQRDEHGNKRIPVLLEQLKLRIKDSSPIPDDDRDRHWIFTIEMEYGSGPSRMSWTVIRTIKDIYNLHFRYKFALRNEKYKPRRMDLGARLKQPKFPYSAFPYLRSARKKGDDTDEEDVASAQGDDNVGEATGTEVQGDGLVSEAEGPQFARRKSRGNLMGALRRRSTGVSEQGDLNAEGGALDQMTRRQRYIEKQRRILEKYLSEMIRWLMFRADSNRLCRFLELSALGVRLAAEGSYHGKEGYLHIQSAKGLDFRRVVSPALVISRHSSKWFLVRQSYIVCVESPENMNIYDVYLVDSKFSLVSKRNTLKQISTGDKTSHVDLLQEGQPEKHHTLTLQSSERKVRLFSRNQSVMRQFEDSINEMLRQTPWYSEKRFNSFAPVRTGVFAQWLVDGRDYMWNVSRAINMAKDVIYIHDWWLSPELYMRRPAAISQKWRLDRLLQKKAREGVKIFIIIYRNVEAAVPIDSEYTKFSLLNLHPNIFVQRSPNQFRKNQFFFAHHEKICVVDHDVAFVGGIDLCFGRWDCPQHPIVDDKPTGFELTEHPRDAEHCQLFPGKDYSNPRVQDFFRLNEPYEEMYNRSQVPRMPWHDISMQVVGQPARDLTRHFVQRWNYLRRGRKPTRPLPFLLPPPDAKMEELEALGLTGTCEVQILRSASTWSIGISETEHSIQTAYIRMIEDSEHFVYMENQFFITSTEVYGTKIQNHIGDALVNRIIRAHENDEDWRCIIVIPLMPGFQNTVDEQDGTSVRLILMCQFRSICRGEHSIFGRLQAAGIDPEEYINFFSLRQWGVIGNDVLVTEQLYIHAKTIIVDDRVALIGSANINERSMLGSRDSECAAIVRDTDMIWSTMGGEPYRVGRFAHTLRLRLMREHLGLDVDEILEEERQQETDQKGFENEMAEIYAEDPVAPEVGSSSLRPNNLRPDTATERLQSFNHGLHLEKANAEVLKHKDASQKPATTRSQSHSTSSSPSPSSRRREMSLDVDPRVVGNQDHHLDVSGYGADHWRAAELVGLDEGRDSVTVKGQEVLVHNIDADGKGTLQLPQQPREASPASVNRHPEPINEAAEALPPMPPLDRRTTEQVGFPRIAQLPALPVVDDTDIGGPPVHFDQSGRPISGVLHPMATDIKYAYIDKDCMKDPINSNFIEEVWNRSAQNNTKLYRRVFRCMPDSEVSTWAEYREYVDYGTKFKASMDGGTKVSGDHATNPEVHGTSTSAGIGVAAPGPDAILKAAGLEAAKITEKIADLVLPEQKDVKKGTVSGSDKRNMELNEKTSISGDHGEHSREADTQIRNDNLRPGDIQPPLSSQSDVPFPPLEGNTTNNTNAKFLEPQAQKERDRRTTFSTLEKPTSRDASSGAPPSAQIGSVKRRRRGTTKGSRRGFTIEDMPSRADAGELLKLVQGNLVQFPYDWLLTEENNGNWGYQVDGVAPLSI